ncbi:MAG: wax ester/triacylglycerol synthase family O-acyltransferase [Actinomycetota bacterium]
MSAMDAEFLHVEDGVNHMHIASCAVFDGPPLSEQERRDLTADALSRIPRYRQVARQVPLQIGRPVWVDDPAFDLDHHLYKVTLAAPGDDEALASLMGDLMSRELDRRHPLWEAWYVEGLADDRWALISKVHHCMVDGIAGTGLMEQMLSIEPDARPPAAAEESDDWEPSDFPTDTQLVVDAFAEMVGTLPRLAKDAVDMVTDPVGTVRRAKELAEGVRAAGHDMTPAPETSIDGIMGADRRWTGTEASLDDVRIVRKGLGGTVNDVVLAAITGGFRDLLLARGEDPDELELRSLVPVSVRHDEDAVDNQVSGMVAELPIHLEDPVERLAAVREEIDRLKESHEIDVGESLAGLADLVPPMMLAWGTRALMVTQRRRPQRNISTVTTNVPGPQFPLYAAGRQMRAMFPFVPIAVGIRVAVAILSYDGDLFFGVTGDEATSPDIEVVTDGIDRSMRELVLAAEKGEATAD